MNPDFPDPKAYVSVHTTASINFPPLLSTTAPSYQGLSRSKSIWIYRHEPIPSELYENKLVVSWLFNYPVQRTINIFRNNKFDLSHRSKFLANRIFLILFSSRKTERQIDRERHPRQGLHTMILPQPCSQPETQAHSQTCSGRSRTEPWAFQLIPASCSSSPATCGARPRFFFSFHIHGCNPMTESKFKLGILARKNIIKMLSHSLRL